MKTWQQRFLDRGIDGRRKCCTDLKQVFGVNGVGWEALKNRGGYRYFPPEGARRRSLPLELLELVHYFPRTNDVEARNWINQQLRDYVDANKPAPPKTASRRAVMADVGKGVLWPALVLGEEQLQAFVNHNPHVLYNKQEHVGVRLLGYQNQHVCSLSKRALCRRVTSQDLRDMMQRWRERAMGEEDRSMQARLGRKLTAAQSEPCFLSGLMWAHAYMGLEGEGQHVCLTLPIDNDVHPLPAHLEEDPWRDEDGPAPTAPQLQQALQGLQADVVCGPVGLGLWHATHQSLVTLPPSLTQPPQAQPQAESDSEEGNKRTRDEGEQDGEGSEDASQQDEELIASGGGAEGQSPKRHKTHHHTGGGVEETKDTEEEGEGEGEMQDGELPEEGFEEHKEGTEGQQPMLLEQPQQLVLLEQPQQLMLLEERPQQPEQQQDEGEDERSVDTQPPLPQGQQDEMKEEEEETEARVLLDGMLTGLVHLNVALAQVVGEEEEIVSPPLQAAISFLNALQGREDLGMGHASWLTFGDTVVGQGLEAVLQEAEGLRTTTDHDQHLQASRAALRVLSIKHRADLPHLRGTDEAQAIDLQDLRQRAQQYTQEAAQLQAQVQEKRDAVAELRGLISPLQVQAARAQMEGIIENIRQEADTLSTQLEALTPIITIYQEALAELEPAASEVQRVMERQEQLASVVTHAEALKGEWGRLRQALQAQTEGQQ